MATSKELCESKTVLDIKPGEKSARYNLKWARKQLDIKSQNLNLPQSVLNALDEEESLNIETRFEIHNVGSFAERLILASMTPSNQKYGSNCFGTSLYLADVIPLDIFIWTRLRTGYPRLEDYLERFSRVSSWKRNAIVIYHNEREFIHALYWNRMRKEFFGRAGFGKDLRGYKSLPKSDNLSVSIFEVPNKREFADLSQLSLEEAKDYAKASQDSEK